MIRCNAVAMIVLGALASEAMTARAVTVLSDTFGTSTLNAAMPGGPTANSTNYAVLSSKTATGSSLAPGSLKLTIAPTTSGLAEVQALFASTPISLAAEGDFVQLSATFVPTGIVYIASGNATINVGLFNSHGTTPVTGGQMNAGQLGSGETQIAFATGFAAGWEGFATRVQASGSRVYTRPIQTDTTNESQDLLFSDSGGGAFDNPVGVTLSPNGPGITFTSGSIYTYTFTLTRSGDVLAIAQNIYEGADATGTNLMTHATLSTAQTITTQFDGFAIGYRGINDATTTTPEHALNFSRIDVTTNLALAPPANANFDADADVDGDDFLKWQRGFGLTGETTIANGDANRSGTVDGGDLTVWKSQFGQPPVAGNSAVGAVPEPTSGALAAVAGALVAAVRRRRERN